MKKFLYIPLAAALAWVGCKDEQEEIKVETRRPMLFDVRTNNDFTRGIPSEIENELKENGILFSCQYAEGGTTVRKSLRLEFDPETNYFGPNLDGNEPLYWPEDGNIAVTIAAIAGGNLEGFSDDTEDPFGEILIPSDEPYTDFLATSMTLTLSETTNGVIDLTLEHIMSSVSITLQGGNADQTYQVDEVMLSREEGDLRTEYLVYDVTGPSWSNTEYTSDPTIPDRTIDYGFPLGPEPGSSINIIGTDTHPIIAQGSDDDELLKLYVVPGTYKLRVYYKYGPMGTSLDNINPQSKEAEVPFVAGNQHKLIVTLPPLTE